MVQILSQQALSGQPDPAKLPLPRLRNDLILQDTSSDVTGQPRWHIIDTSANRYFSIGYAAFHLFRLWKQCKYLGELVDLVNKQTALSIDINQGERFLSFLCHQNLVVGHTKEFIQRYLTSLKRVQKHWLKKLAHNYLFFRIPLIFPDAFLTRTYPFLRIFYMRSFFVFIGIIGFLGLIVAIRQWEVYQTTFLDFVSFKGFVYYTTAIVLAKVLHEFGHAFTAKHFGCNVPSMGLAFLVMWPILYTDGTSSWQLRSKRQRLLIDSAGVIVEICIAAVATFLWAFLPEGPIRSTCFALGTVTLISTLAVNLNFMMRFDGYFILSDLTGIDNLQTRAFLLAKWRMREVLFGMNQPPPEQPRLRDYRLMLFYAYTVWVYRFFLFIGIAVLVYSFFFKLLGIILFFIEILFFIALPIYREVLTWVRLRESVQWNHASRRLTLFFSLFLVLMAFPWNNEIVIPAILEPDNLTVIHNRNEGIIVDVHVGNNEYVNEGDILISMESPELKARLNQAKMNIQYAEVRERIARLNPDYLSERNVSRVQTERHRGELAAVQQLNDDLTVKAPSSGQVFDLDINLKPGLWLKSSQPLMHLGNTEKSVVYAYVEERFVERIVSRPVSKNEAVFIPKDYGWPKLNLHIHHIDRSNLTVLDQESLSSIYGGPINVMQGRNGELSPVVSTYRMRLEPTADDFHNNYSKSLLGVIRVKVKSEAPIEALFRVVVGTILREANL